MRLPLERFLRAERSAAKSKRRYPVIIEFVSTRPSTALPIGRSAQDEIPDCITLASAERCSFFCHLNVLEFITTYSVSVPTTVNYGWNEEAKCVFSSLKITAT